MLCYILKHYRLSMNDLTGSFENYEEGLRNQLSGL